MFDVNALVDSSVTLAVWTAATETMQIEQRIHFVVVFKLKLKRIFP